MKTVKKDIQIYADSVELIEAQADTLNIHLDGVDIGQITDEFSVKDVLDSLDFDAIAEYVDNERKD